MKAVIVPTKNKRLPTSDNLETLHVNTSLRSSISNQVNSLSNTGVDEILIILGFGNEEFANFIINCDEIKIKIKIIPNPFQFQCADSLIALWMAMCEINDDVFILSWESLLRGDNLQNFIKYEDGSSCFLINKKINCTRDNESLDDHDISEIDNHKDLKHLLASGSIDLCTFRQSSVALIKESIEDEIRSDNANKKELTTAIYRLIRKEHMVCKVKSLDIGDIYKIYADSPKSSFKVAANSSDHLGKSQGYRNLHAVNTNSE